MMYQVAMAQLRASDIATPLRELFGANAPVQPHMDAVTAVDPDNRRVHYSSGRVATWDVLVLATGARYQYFGHAEWRQHVLTMKSLADAMRLRERVFTALEMADRAQNDAQRRACLTFMIVGAGATGVELAGALGRLLPRILKHRFARIDARELHIVVADPEQRALPTMPAELGRYADHRLKSLGVDLMTGTAVEDIKSGHVQLQGGRILRSETIIWAAGVEGHGAGDWLPPALVDKHNRVPVETDLSVPGHPDVYVIGDAASAHDPDGNPYPGLAAVAKQQGGYVAKRIRARLAHAEDDAPERFHYRDYGSLAMIANGTAVGVIRGRAFKGFAAWLLWGGVHLYFLVGARNRVLVLSSWFWAMLSERRQRVTLGGRWRADMDEAHDADRRARP